MFLRSSIIFAVVSFISFATWALPNCLDNKGKVLADNTEQVIQWKTSTQNQFHSRGHVTGTVGQIYPDQTNHIHFQMQLGNQGHETIEVIYNRGFGKNPEVHTGDTAEVCGDYITTGTDLSHRGSPDGAIIHWVHENPSRRGHPSGYVALNGVVFGTKERSK